MIFTCMSTFSHQNDLVEVMFNRTLSEKKQPAERPKQNLCIKRKLEQLLQLVTEGKCYFTSRY